MSADAPSLSEDAADDERPRFLTIPNGTDSAIADRTRQPAFRLPA